MFLYMNIKLNKQKLKASEILRKEIQFLQLLALTRKACLNAEISKFFKVSNTIGVKVEVQILIVYVHVFLFSFQVIYYSS